VPPLLNASAQITCCHQGGPAVIVPTQAKVRVGGGFALVAGDVSGAVVTCPVAPSPASKPCTTATVMPVPGASASTKVMIGGRPALLGNPAIPGITDGAPVPCPTLMVRYPGQMVVIATA
jgi:hypothetical protein